MKQSQKLPVIILALFLALLNLPVLGISVDKAEPTPKIISFAKKEDTQKEKSAAPEYTPGQLIVKLKEGQDIGSLLELHTAYKVTSYTKLLKDMPGIKVAASGAKAQEHRVWYWQLDKDSKEYKDYRQRIEKSGDKELQEALKAHIELRQQRAPHDVAIPDFENTYLLKTSSDINILVMAKAYSQSSLVEYAEPNYVYSQSLVPNDTYYSSYQWGPKTMGAEAGWDISQGENIRVAVIDTGMDVTHEDLSGQIVSPYDVVDIDKKLWSGTYWELAADEDYTGLDSDPKDLVGHGTHVAGTIAASTNNSKGVAGMAGKAKIMPVRAGFKIIYKGRETGLFETDDIINALIYAADNGADVINMSLGGTGLSYTLRDAVRYAYSQGCVVVVAAGNSDQDSAYYSPAMYSDVISVGAIDSDEQRASFSNYGHMVDVAAPGVAILSTYPTALTPEGYTPYAMMAGTSMACPHVSGAVAQLLSKNSSMGIEQVRATLRATAGDGSGVRNNDVGYGIVKIDRALNNSVNHYGSITSPEFFAGALQGIIKIKGSATGSDFKSYTLEYCKGLFPDGQWNTIKESTSKIDNGELAEWDAASLSLGTYTLRLTVEGNNSSYKHQMYHKVYLTTNNQSGWPRIIGFLPGYLDYQQTSPLFADIDADGLLDCGFMSSGGGVYFWDKEGKLKNGFPIQMRSFSSTSLNAADINNDGKPEIIAGMKGYRNYEDGELYAFDYQGNLLSGWPPSGLSIGRSFERINPSLGNIDADTDLEVVTNINSGQGKFYAFKSNGAYASGWPVSNASLKGEAPVLADIDGDNQLEAIGLGEGEILLLDGNGSLIRSINLNIAYADSFESPSLVVGDVDGDNQLEIVACVDTQDSGKRYSFFIYELDGTLVSSWNIAQPDNTVDDVHYYRNVVLGDLNKDGKNEIIFATPYSEGSKETDILENKIYAWDYQGNLFFGKTIDLGIDETIYSSAVLADLDGDAQPEIVIGTDSGKIYAYDRNGDLVNGFPVDTEGWIRAPLAIADVDSDGKLEALAVSADGVVNLVELPSSGPADRLEWPMFQHDSRHTGCYVVPDATIPRLKTLELQSGYEGQKITFKLQAEKGTPSYTYSAVSGTLPQGASLTSDGTFSWTPGYEQSRADNYILKATVTDSKGNVSQEQAYSVKAYNSSLYGVIKDTDSKAVISGARLDLVRKSDGVTVYTTNSDSQGKYLITQDIDTGEYRLEVSFSGYNDKTIDVSLTKGQTNEANVELTVYVANNAPVFSPNSDTQTVTEETENFIYTLPLISENYGQNLSYTLEGRPDWLSYNQNSRKLSGKAPYESERSYTIKWIASDTEGESAFILILKVNNKERPPEFKQPSDSLKVSEGDTLKYTFPKVERNYGTGLQYSLTDKPEWASINITTGTLTATAGTIPYTASGTYALQWVASDSDGSAAFVLNLAVNNVNRAPMLNTIGNKVVAEGSNLSVSITATDADGDSLTYATKDKLPEGAFFNTSSAAFSWTPDYTQAGIYTLTFYVSDGSDSDSEEITITVNNTAHAPEFSQTSDTQIITEDTDNFNYALPEVTRNYGQNLEYRLENSPQWLDFNENSRTLRGKAPYDSKRSYEIKWIANDSDGEATFTLTINVTDKQRLPEFSKDSDKINVSEGERLDYTLPEAKSQITDEALTYSVTEKPKFVSVDTSSRKVSGDIPYDKGAGDYQIVWKAAGHEGEDSFTLHIAVKNVNRSPVIETIPDYTINEGESVSLTVNTYDNDSEDTIVTTLKHAPDGASFIDLVFKWTPTHKQSGKYTLTLTSSDGKAKAEQDFKIEVLDAKDTQEESEDKSKENDSTKDSDTTTDSSSKDSSQQDSDTSKDEESEVSTTGRTWVVVQQPKKSSTTDEEKKASSGDKGPSKEEKAEVDFEDEERQHTIEDNEQGIANRPESLEDIYEEQESQYRYKKEVPSASSVSAASMNFMALHNDKGIIKEIQMLNERADIVHSYKVKYGKRNLLIGLLRDDNIKAYLYIDKDGITLNKVKIKNANEITEDDLKKEIDGIIAFMGYAKNS